MAAWAPEITVDQALASRLIASQFPEVELGSLELIGEGWDNTVWLVDERWVFRFPRREIALAGFLRELDVLPALAPSLPTQVPAPAFRGDPSEEYPWPFFGAAHIPGDELGGSPVDEAELARQLGAFLRTLHGIEPPVELPVDPNGRTDMTRRAGLAREHLATLERLGLWTAPDFVEALLDRANDLTLPDAAVLAHGDLHFRHVLVSEDGSLSGVIDWGDVCIAAPGIDLLLYWSAFSPDGRKAFLDAYGPVAEDELVRARVLALGINAILAAYGQAEGRKPVKDEALASLERAIAD